MSGAKSLSWTVMRHASYSHVKAGQNGQDKIDGRTHGKLSRVWIHYRYVQSGALSFSDQNFEMASNVAIRSFQISEKASS